MERAAESNGSHRKSLVVAIDGPCGVGKSSLARQLAKGLDFSHLDSGALYRAVTLRALEKGANFEEPEALAAIAAEAELQIVETDGGMRVYSRERDVSDDIRSPTVSGMTARVADVRPVRELINEIQRRFARGRRVVADGRDIATVVFPDAEVKIYLDASLDARAQRRFDQYANDPAHRDETYKTVRDAIAERDRRDAARPFGALRRHPRAILVDSTDLDYDSTLARLEEIVRAAEADRPEDQETPSETLAPCGGK